MAGFQFKVDTKAFAKDLDKVAQRMSRVAPRVEHSLAIQMERDTEQYVPALTGNFVDDTKVIGNTIIYPGPFARYLYRGKVMVDSKGRGPMVFYDKYGNKVIRFPAGSTLHPTDRDLVFSKSFNPKAQSHWFEASKAQNLDKWRRMPGKEMQREFRK